jgi:hypothetical protein
VQSFMSQIGWIVIFSFTTRPSTYFFCEKG